MLLWGKRYLSENNCNDVIFVECSEYGYKKNVYLIKF